MAEKKKARSSEEGKIRQFELKNGTGPHIHVDDDGSRVKYEAGEVIHTPHDLNTLFPHKFRELGINKAATKKEATKKDSESDIKRDRDHFEPADEHPRKKKNVPVEEEEDAEDEIEPPVGDPQDEEEEEKSTRKSKKGEESDEEEDETEVKSKLGKDATGKFPEAAKSDLKVFKGKRGYMIADADEPDKPMSKPLKTPKAVDTFLKDYRKKG